MYNWTIFYSDQGEWVPLDFRLKLSGQMKMKDKGHRSAAIPSNKLPSSSFATFSMKCLFSLFCFGGEESSSGTILVPSASDAGAEATANIEPWGVTEIDRLSSCNLPTCSINTVSSLMQRERAGDPHHHTWSCFSFCCSCRLKVREMFCSKAEHVAFSWMNRAKTARMKLEAFEWNCHRIFKTSSQRQRQEVDCLPFVLLSRLTSGSFESWREVKSPF